MNMKLELNQKTLIALGRALYRGRIVLALLVAAGVTGYTAYQLRLIISLAPSAATLATERQKISDGRVKFDTKALDAANALTPVEVKATPVNLGKYDPFSP